MKNLKFLSFFYLTLICFVFLCSCHSSKPVVKIGLNVELTGEVPAVGASCLQAAKLFVSEVNQAGGLDVGGQHLPIELVIGDNSSKPDEAVAVSQRLIAHDGVVAMVGPNISSCAVPSSEIAESFGCLMISPWSTHLKTTRDASGGFKKNVFRACFTELVEAPILAQFAITNLHATTAAILYDMSSESPNSIAHQFQESFIKEGGNVLAMETYTTGDRDFSAQLTKIKTLKPDVLFIPAYYNDAPLIAQQARRLGITATFLSYNAWSTPDIIKLDSGNNLEGSYFSNHFSADSDSPGVKKFITSYKAAYNQVPDDVAALTYDTMALIATAITKAGSLDRSAIQQAMATIENFSGVTGNFQYSNASHDPLKGVVILSLNKGAFVYLMTKNY